MYKKIISVFVLFALIISLVSCTVGKGGTDNTAPSDQSEDTVTEGSDSSVTLSASEVPDLTLEDMFTERDGDFSYDVENCISVELTGDTATSDSPSVTVDSGTVTVTENKTHVFTGSLENGMIIVDADENAKIQLVLNGVDISKDGCAAIYVKNADKVFVTAAENTVNRISSSGEFVQVDDNNVDAAVFSKQDLTVNGEGTLEISSSNGHGIVSKDDIAIVGGDLTVNSAGHGIEAKDSIRTYCSTITVTSGKDGLHGESSDDAALGFVYINDCNISVQAQGDGISSSSYVQIDGGELDILTGGGSVNGEKTSSDGWGGYMGMGRMQESDTSSSDSSESIKGIKAAANILIKDGIFIVDSADDALHSNGNITVNGGDLTISTGDDALHADQTLTVASGNITVNESYEGLEGLDIIISGGVLRIVSSDDGINAAGGVDQSGYGGPRGDEQFGGYGAGHGGMGAPGAAGGPGGIGSSGSDGSIEISGGEICINASGDGIDANGSLEINGGTIIVCGPTHGDTATLDYDLSAVINGGTFIGTGASGMAQTFSDSTQGVISLSVGNQNAETPLKVTDSSGNVIIDYTPELSYAVMIVSSPLMVSGESYTVTIGDYSGEFVAD